MEHMTSASVRDRLSEVVSRVDSQHEQVMVTRYGQPTVVIMSSYDLECIEEPLEATRCSGADSRRPLCRPKYG
jgi:prevent-host-death family protein